jgi:Zn-dependent protease with chaperone function
MRIAIALPLILAIVTTVVTPRLTAGLRPRAAAFTLTSTAVAVALATGVSLSLTAWLFVSSLQPVAATGRWRASDVATASPIPPVVAAVGLVVLIAVGARLVQRAVRIVRAGRPVLALERTVPSRGGPARLVVIDEPRFVAHAVAGLPGCGGHIVVSRAGLDELDDPELRRAMIEHERAHLRHHHATFRTLTDLAVAVNPLAGRLATMLSFALERWADEAAARRTSRRAVAEALAVASLAATATPPAMAFSDVGVAARVGALLTQPDVWRLRTAIVDTVLAVGLVVCAVATVQACRDVEVLYETLRLWAHPPTAGR